jgi:hypothetical protein
MPNKRPRRRRGLCSAILFEFFPGSFFREPGSEALKKIYFRASIILLASSLFLVLCERLDLFFGLSVVPLFAIQFYII